MKPSIMCVKICGLTIALCFSTTGTVLESGAAWESGWGGLVSLISVISPAASMAALILRPDLTTSEVMIAGFSSTTTSSIVIVSPDVAGLNLDAVLTSELLLPPPVLPPPAAAPEDDAATAALIFAFNANSTVVDVVALVGGFPVPTSESDGLMVCVVKATTSETCGGTDTLDNIGGVASLPGVGIGKAAATQTKVGVVVGSDVTTAVVKVAVVVVVADITVDLTTAVFEGGMVIEGVDVLGRALGLGLAALGTPGTLSRAGCETLGCILAVTCARDTDGSMTFPEMLVFPTCCCCCCACCCC
uniref:Uncharacterized protein n=1 Tax=Arion vulgaris TaxID=1028688 RepID=A0A0B7B9W3_9EUPU